MNIYFKVIIIHLCKAVVQLWNDIPEKRRNFIWFKTWAAQTLPKIPREQRMEEGGGDHRSGEAGI